MNKTELQGEIENIMRTLGTISFETSVAQTDMYKLLAEIVTEQIGNGGILRHRLARHKERLELALSFFNNFASKFSIEQPKTVEFRKMENEEILKCVNQ